jgi:hypothetical protein
MMLDVKEAAHLLARGGVQEQQQEPRQQQQPQVQQQQEPQHQMGGAQEQAGLLAQQQGAHRYNRGLAGGGDRHRSHTLSGHDFTTINPAAAAGSGDNAAQAGGSLTLAPPADLALLLLMAAARAVKAGVNYHCFGSSCNLCEWWHLREGVGVGGGRDQEDDAGVDGGGSNCTASHSSRQQPSGSRRVGDEAGSNGTAGGGCNLHRQQGQEDHGSSSSAGGDHHPPQEQPSDSRGVDPKVESLSAELAEKDGQTPEPERCFSPGLKDLDQLEAALDALLTLVHCLVVKGAWWQQAVEHRPLLLLQVLLTVSDVSSGNEGAGYVSRILRIH